MRIGFVTTSFPRHPLDIAGRFVWEMAAALALRGHSVEVLAPEPAEARTPTSWPGIDVRWIPYLRPRVLQRTFYGAGVPDNLRHSAAAWLGLGPYLAQTVRAVRNASFRWDAAISHWALPSESRRTLASRRGPLQLPL